MTLSSLVEAPALIKIIGFFFVWGGVWFPVALVTALALKWRPQSPLLTSQKLAFLASLYLIVPGLIWGISQVEGVSISDYGWVWEPQQGLSFARGFALAVLSLILLLGLEIALGWLHWQPQATSEASPEQPLTLRVYGAKLLAIVLLAVWISATEELVFRGFLQNQLQQDFSPLIAAVIASSLFALSHLIWAVRDTLPQLLGLGLMGIVLFFARMNDGGNLGLAIGLHAGWIWGMTSLDATVTIITTQRVPQWVTGEANKPLAGLMGIGMLLLMAGVLH